MRSPVCSCAIHTWRSSQNAVYSCVRLIYDQLINSTRHEPSDIKSTQFLGKGHLSNSFVGCRASDIYCQIRRQMTCCSYLVAFSEKAAMIDCQRKRHDSFWSVIIRSIVRSNLERGWWRQSEILSLDRVEPYFHTKRRSSRFLILSITVVRRIACTSAVDDVHSCSSMEWNFSRHLLNGESSLSRCSQDWIPANWSFPVRLSCSRPSFLYTAPQRFERLLARLGETTFSLWGIRPWWSSSAWFVGGHQLHDRHPVDEDPSRWVHPWPTEDPWLLQSQTNPLNDAFLIQDLVQTPLVLTRSSEASCTAAFLTIQHKQTGEMTCLRLVRWV